MEVKAPRLQTVSSVPFVSRLVCSALHLLSAVSIEQCHTLQEEKVRRQTDNGLQQIDERQTVGHIVIELMEW